jgi:hypothetical protein
VRLFGTPAMVSSGDGRLELFVTAEDSALWHIWQTTSSNGWSGWDNPGARQELQILDRGSRHSHVRWNKTLRQGCERAPDHRLKQASRLG